MSPSVINGEKATLETPTFAQKRQRTLDMLIRSLYQDLMPDMHKVWASVFVQYTSSFYSTSLPFPASDILRRLTVPTPSKCFEHRFQVHFYFPPVSLPWKWLSSIVCMCFHYCFYCLFLLNRKIETVWNVWVGAGGRALDKPYQLWILIRWYNILPAALAESKCAL